MVLSPYMPMTLIEVKKNQNENNQSLLRRFTRRMQESGSVRKVKSQRYASRPKSKLVQKETALRRIAKIESVEKLKKLGKLK